MQIIGRGSFEAVLLIEVPSFLILRVHENGSPTDNLGTFYCPPKGVKNHMGTYPLALFCLVDRQAGKQNHRYVLGPLSFRNSRRNVQGRDATGSQIIEGDHFVPPCRHVRS